MKVLRAIMLCLFLVTIVFAQELKTKKNNSDKSVRSGINSSIGLKKQIPNYDGNIKKSVTIKSRSTGNMENSGNAHKAIAKKQDGISNSFDKDQQTFHECKEKPGYPIGWITNSDIPILKRKNNRNYIVLGELTSNLYLGEYISVAPNSSWNYCISCQNNSSVKLQITQYNERNKKIDAPIEISLPNGNYGNFKCNIETSDKCVKLFVKIIKTANGEFTLHDADIEGVER